MVGERNRKISNPKVRKFVERVKKEFKPSAFYLFGSRAGNDFMNYSDWDFLIVSRKFEGLSFRDRIDEVLKLVDYPVGQDIEPLCYTLKEFNERKQGLNIVSEAVEKGIKV
ncbi:MAG: nucleotidyltransferase domain-containing protein [archaeon]